LSVLHITPTGFTNGLPTSFRYDTTTYGYDVDGYMIKQEKVSTYAEEGKAYSYKNTFTSIFKIENGNAISKTELTNDTITATTTYEYYNDSINRSGDGASNGFMLWPNARGKLNKNLLKKLIVNNQTTEYFYNLNQDGNVIKQMISINGRPKVTTIDEIVYNCDKK